MQNFLPFIYCALDRRPGGVVLLQDAAGQTSQPYGARGLRFGAFSLAAAQPPAAEIREVLNSIETVGRAGVLPVGLGGDAVLRTTSDQPLIERTSVPRSWATDAVKWRILLSRRWRFPVGIGEGETRAQTMWPRILGRCRAFRRLEFLDLGDNQGAVGLTARGR